MDPAFEINANASPFEAIRLIVEHDCVLVPSGDNKITGIVTTADLSEQFAKLGRTVSAVRSDREPHPLPDRGQVH
jgi:CBS-domain-containing membrane protein